ncbi:MAG: DUF3422 domain-containing protein [Burkholderiales bacterium]|nr:DUF3422 domain-containing protein [Burkholderiales bacterium]
MIAHPQRALLHNELHARPRPPLSGPHRVSMFALVRPAASTIDPIEPLRTLCRDYRQPEPSPGQGHFFADFGTFRLKWERHGEFDDYTVYRAGADSANPFAQTALEVLPQDWIAALPGECIAAAHIVVPSARVFTDMQLDARGSTRFLLLDVTMSPTHTGREVQRLIDIEMYRMMAMLAFPIARSAAGELDRIEQELTSLAQRLETAVPAQEPQLLGEVTHLAAMIERLSGESNFRFSAARAYHSLVRQRGAELREERLTGVQTLTGFLDRRFEPAMAFCDSVANRIEAAAQRVARASSLLRTRVEIERETQNQEMLAAMNRRASLQLRLQETVEGLSVAAVTYYAVGLFGYLAKAAGSAGVPINPELATGLSVLPIALGVALAIRYLRRSVLSRTAAEGHRDL